MNTAIFTIIAGLNGVGKSSFTGARNIENCIDVDKIAKEYKISNFEAGKIALNKINEYFNKRLSFAQETTLSGLTILKTVDKAKMLGYKISLVYIGLDSLEESIIRIDNRVKRGGHSISVKDILRRYEKRFTVLFKLLPQCDNIEFLDNNNGFVEATEQNEWYKIILKRDNE